MTIALIVMTDGRTECLERTVASLQENLLGPVSERWMFDDTGDETYRGHLAERYPEFIHINGGPRQGFGGAIRSAWSYLLSQSVAPFVFSLEDDFVFNEPVDSAAMAAVLARRPEVAQLVLLRQPWNAEERAFGGIIECHPDEFDERTDGEHRWTEHRRFWSTNPNLCRRTLIETHNWPEGNQSEGHFTHQLLLAHPNVRFAFWGGRNDLPRVTHIGDVRAGVGY